MFCQDILFSKAIRGSYWVWRPFTMRGAGLLCLLCVCCASPAALSGAGGAGPGLGAGARLRARTATGRTPPLPEGRCVVYGMTMFEGAMWSPEPCTVCQCQGDMVKCKPSACDPGPAVGKVQVVKKTSVHQGVGGGGRRSSSKTSTSRGQEVKETSEHQGEGGGARRSSSKTSTSRGGQEVKETSEHQGEGGGARRSSSKTSTSRGQEVRTKGQTRPAGGPEQRPAGGPPSPEQRPAGGPEQRPAGGPPSPEQRPAGGPPSPEQRPAGGPEQRPAGGPEQRPAGGPPSPAAVPPAVKTPVAPRSRRPHNSSDEEDRDSSDEDEDAEDEDVVGPPHPPPAKAKVNPPTPSPSVLRTAPPRPPARGAGGRPVVAFPQKPPFMASLPWGCLLADTLVACGSTGLSRMPLISDRGVRTLYLADNKISRIPAKALAGLPNLEWLDLSKNKLDDASFAPLLFQNLTRLRRLILDGNNLTRVPASLPPSLLELKINDNQLSGLTPRSFKGLSKLLTLELEDNHFHDGNVSPLTFRPLRKLAYLRLDDNRFRGVPSGLPVSLQELHLSDNKIEVVQAGILNKTVNLRALDLSHNRIREDRIAPHALIHLLKLESLDLSHNWLVHVPSFLPPGVRQLVLHHNLIQRIPAFVFGHLAPGLDSLHLSHNRLQDGGLAPASFRGLSSSLAELLLDHNLLHSVPRGLLQLRNLQHLRLNHNLISDVPLGALCDPGAREDSPLLSVHLENNLIQRHLVPPSSFSCIRSYHSVLLRPQRDEE
ncbi:extracellular matrix protein 2-like isoform X2 [Gadus macrocephalus]|uniref:extracellular matrix protein 2-like isoform X2 n=1 Tax=Gadus macrocephalus TaxID=80720 RepID=UPI0028CB66E8|nr:extracellular matrix protein 2-like isoform X2 [Gadus macrocephalus]